MRQHKQVLVVGAGPVGLMTALELHDRGIGVSIVDRKEAGDARSYAVVLHPRVLRSLIDRGLTQTLLWQGCALNEVVLFTDGEKRATLHLMPASEVSGGGLSLPQNVLRSALEGALRDRGIDVRYRHDLVSVEAQSSAVVAGLVGPDGRTTTVVADFVVGADGQDSTVRKLLGIELAPRGPRESYVFFDVPKHPLSGTQVQLTLTDTFSSAIIPLHGGMMRFAFQLPIVPRAPDLTLLKDLIAQRMPWHHDDVEGIEWSGAGAFRRAVVDQFGKDRVWLAGDAAHATSPLGVQSLNVGLHEARELAATIVECVRNGSPTLLAARYQARRQAEWNRLLASTPNAPLPPRVPDWVKRHLPRIVASLPASGDDLDDLLDQLGVSLL
jgi:2-polyprenyl-6-methoxyphenol hydroxylase-like FAD-dependent oxidoreductase